MKSGTKSSINRFSTLYYLIIVLFACHSNSQGQQFAIYNRWDFEEVEPGSYSALKVMQDFDIYSLWHDDKGTIVYDTINKSPTKVLKVNNPPGVLWEGFQMYAHFDTYKELYMSYNIKFDKDWNSTAGGKLPGLRGLPPGSYDNCPDSPDDGFYLCPMFKRAGSMISYHYDRTPPIHRIGDPGWPNDTYCPWAIEDYDYDSIFFSNGVWYNITQRLVTNTSTNGTPNPDGINEIWVDGKLIFRESELILVEDTAKGINGLFLGTYYGGSSDSYKPVRESHLYLDNITLYMPDNDSVIGQKTHHPSSILPTPDPITDREVYYDELITTEGTLSNSEYGTTYSPCIDEAYLIDAGEGNTVTFNNASGNLGGGDYLIFYDGNTTDAPFIDMTVGTGANLNKTRKSSGRYMFIRFSTDVENSGTGWSGTISFSTTDILEKKNEGNSQNRIKIIPNPGTNRVSISGIQNKAELSVYDIMGRQVLLKNNISNNQQLDVSSLSRGIYTMIFNEKDKYTSIFIKQ